LPSYGAARSPRSFLKLFWLQAPKRLAAAIGLALGWVAAVAFVQLLKLPVSGLLLLVAGGLLYSLGAIIYARRRPDPIPHILGYHEIFHLLTLAAAACQSSCSSFFHAPRSPTRAKEPCRLRALPQTDPASRTGRDMNRGRRESETRRPSRIRDVHSGRD